MRLLRELGRGPGRRADRRPRAGVGSATAITDWAGHTGRLVTRPQPGDLILFGTEHVGIVQSVNADVTLTTVEGNASNAVSIEHHSPGDATGFVRL